MRGLDRVGDAVRGLAPVYFALVMASGAISVAAHATDLAAVSTVLYVAAAGAYVVLVCMTVWRVLAYPKHVRADAHHPGRSFGFFTIVAGSCVLGERLVFAGLDELAYVMLIGGAAVWLVLGYLLPWMALGRRRGEPSAHERADGSWFIWSVASQSIAVLAATLEPAAGRDQHALAFLAFVAWSVGCFLYVTAIVLVGLRLVLYEVTPHDLSPSYWVSMGAASITVLAGSKVAMMRTDVIASVVNNMATGVSLMFWALATWLFPALLAAGWWRHIAHRVPFSYEPALWSMVFPLGMYALASISLGDTAGLSWIATTGEVELWLAVVVWLLVCVAMVHHLYRAFRSKPTTPAP